MKTRRRLFRLPLLASLVAAALVASPLVATSSVLGPDGTILKLRGGTYGELFPEGRIADAKNAVLALDLVQADGEHVRLLVPGTENFADEVAANLVVEDATGIAYLLWEGFHNGFHPTLYLTSFATDRAAGGWGELIEISSSPFARKSQPQLMVTREADGGRLVMHVAWSEENGGGNVKRYAPIVIEDGEHARRPPVWDLSSFLGGEEGLFSEIDDALRLVPGSSDGAVVVAWLTENGDRVASAEMELVPRALEELADKARAQIINGGARGRGKSRALLAAEIHELILGYGGGFHEAGLRHIAEAVHAIVLAFPDPITDATVPGLGDKARAQIINGGLRFKTGGLEAPGGFDVVEVIRPAAPEQPHLVKVRVLSERPAPVVGGTPMLYPSARDGGVIVAWDEEDVVRYVNSRDEGWSETQTLILGDELDRAAAHAMLTARARDR